MPEAVRLPAVGAVFFTEASLSNPPGERPFSAPSPRLLPRLTAPLPPPLRWRADSRGIVLCAPPVRYDHLPTEAERATPLAAAPATVEGVVELLDGRFHPRRFLVGLNADRLAYVKLYRSAAATRFGEAGGVALSVRYADGSPGAWAIATFDCTRASQAFTFLGQANANGDLVVSMSGLPPLPASATDDTMTLSLFADPVQSRLPAADPDTLGPRRFRLRAADPMALSQTLSFTRGLVHTARDLGIEAVTLEN